MASPSRPSFFHTQNILAELPEVYSSRLLANSRKVSLRPGECLFEKGDKGDGCYWLEAGILKISIASPRGEKRILAVMGPGAIVGELAMIDGLPRSATVEAVKDCRLTFISRASFVDALHKYPEIYGYLVNILVTRLRQADDETGAASFLTVKARVARAFLQIAEHLGEPSGPDTITIQTNIRQNDLAAMAGVARESVSRTLGEWRRHQIIDQTKQHRYVVNKSK